MSAAMTDGHERPRHYFQIHFRMLRFLGLGWWHEPHEQDTNNFPSYYFPYCILTQLIWVAGFVGLETIDPFIGSKEDVDNFMFSLSFVITHDLTIVKLYLFFFRNKELQRIARILEIDVHSFYQNKERNRKTVKRTRVMTSSFIFFGWATIANSNINGIIQDLRWKSDISKLAENATKPERSLAQPIFIPWNYQNEGSYIATFILEAVGLLWTGHIVMLIDTFIGSLILHMSCQFSNLQEAIETAYDRALSELYGQISAIDDTCSTRNYIEDNKLTNKDVESLVTSHYTYEEIDNAVEKKLRNCIQQHQLLIGCVKQFSKTYSYGFLTQLLSSMAAICVVMVQVSKDASSFNSISFATSLAFFIAMIIQLAMQCITGNELTIEAQRVSDAAINSKWERMSPRRRRELVLLIVRSQRPLCLSAAGFANMNISCFLSIVKAAYSYYAVLSQKQGSRT